MNTKNIVAGGGQFLMHTTDDGRTRVRCLFRDDTLWLTQAQMAELYQVSGKTISEHLTNVYDEDECKPERTIRKFRIVQPEGDRQVRRTLDHYSLEAILAVGYRVRSTRGTQFRQWATERLGEYLVKGFTMDDERLKNPDSKRPNMGLTAWRGGVVRKGDVTVAKNYLRETEISELNRIVVMFLDFAEDQARRRKQIFLENWRTRLDDFLRLNERDILPDAGKVSREKADLIAEQEFERFAARRREQLEQEGEADALKLLEAEVKKLPKSKKPRPRKL